MTQVSGTEPRGNNRDEVVTKGGTVCGKIAECEKRT